VDAVVDEGRQALLVDGVPQAQLSGDPTAEQLHHRQPIAALRRGGEAEQLPWLEVIEQAPVGAGGGMVELVHDDHVEVRRRQVVGARPVETLDGREHVFEALGPPAAHPQLAEGRVEQALAEGRQALREDLLAVGDEEQPGRG
jgi:hypothetical protein